jgi:hypothetical protein
VTRIAYREKYSPIPLNGFVEFNALIAHRTTPLERDGAALIWLLDLETMKWKNCSLDLEQFNCPTTDASLFLRHHLPVFNLMGSSVTARLLGVQTSNEPFAAPNLNRML